MIIKGHSPPCIHIHSSIASHYTVYDLLRYCKICINLIGIPSQVQKKMIQPVALNTNLLISMAGVEGRS